VPAWFVGYRAWRLAVVADAPLEPQSWFFGSTELIAFYRLDRRLSSTGWRVIVDSLRSDYFGVFHVVIMTRPLFGKSVFKSHCHMRTMRKRWRRLASRMGLLLSLVLVSINVVDSAITLYLVGGQSFTIGHHQCVRIATKRCINFGPFGSARRLTGIGGQSRVNGVRSSHCAFVLGFVAAVLQMRPRGTSALHYRALHTSVPQTYDGAPIGPPPDLPSLLLKNRIVYLGSPIRPDVSELIIAQLLYLNYESAEKPVTLYINSTGSSIKSSTAYSGELKIGLETDAFAIADCMQYIKPQVITIAIGQAYGTAAMLLGLGSKGKRFALPNASIMLSEPRNPPMRGPRQASDIHIMASEILHNRRTLCDQLAVATDRTAEQLSQDTSRSYYMSPLQAVEYGLIDRVLTVDRPNEPAQFPES